jgi:two-component system, cell cycle sensor histidine kinase and response regulator CckA
MPVSIMAESTLDLTTVKRRRHETILVVDDEPSIRELLGTILGRVGYRVLVAANACEAASIFEGHLMQIDLVITDVWMPGVDGPRLVEQLLSIQPGLKCILMSANDRPDLERDVPFLSKPFSISQLLSGVIETLEET